MAGNVSKCRPCWRSWHGSVHFTRGVICTKSRVMAGGRAAMSVFRELMSRPTKSVLMVEESLWLS